MQTGFREKRITSRSRVFFGGEILVDSDLPPVECHVKNLSHGGASIVVQSGEFLPNQFDLFIRKTNERHQAVVTWSRGRQLGLAYRPHSSFARKWSSPSALRQMVKIFQA
jgi:PilZ domain